MKREKKCVLDSINANHNRELFYTALDYDSKRYRGHLQCDEEFLFITMISTKYVYRFCSVFSISFHWMNRFYYKKPISDHVKKNTKNYSVQKRKCVWRIYTERKKEAETPIIVRCGQYWRESSKSGTNSLLEIWVRSWTLGDALLIANVLTALILWTFKLFWFENLLWYFAICRERNGVVRSGLECTESSRMERVEAVWNGLKRVG